SQTVKLCVGADLTVSKTAIPHMTTTIAKTGPASPINTSALSTTLNYTVTVTESGWYVDGDITVTNPNAWAVTADVSDSLCSVPNSTGVSIAALGNKILHYSCSLTGAQVAALPSYTGTNTASVTWKSGTAPPPDTVVTSPGVNFTFPTLHVTDAFNGA